MLISTLTLSNHSNLFPLRQRGILEAEAVKLSARPGASGVTS